jgi:hypothetical protein
MQSYVILRINANLKSGGKGENSSFAAGDDFRDLKKRGVI